MVHIFPTCILSGSKANATTICAIILNNVSGKMRLLNQTQANTRTYTIVLLFNWCIPTSIRMCCSAATMIVRKEAN